MAGTGGKVSCDEGAVLPGARGSFVASQQVHSAADQVGRTRYEHS